MKNGDIIRLRQDLVITATRTLDYRYQDYPMQTIEELEALMDEIEQEVSPDDTVNLYLAACNLFGAPGSGPEGIRSLRLHRRHRTHGLYPGNSAALRLRSHLLPARSGSYGHRLRGGNFRRFPGLGRALQLYQSENRHADLRRGLGKSLRVPPDE